MIGQEHSADSVSGCLNAKEPLVRGGHCHERYCQSCNIHPEAEPGVVMHSCSWKRVVKCKLHRWIVGQMAVQCDVGHLFSVCK